MGAGLSLVAMGVLRAHSLLAGSDPAPAHAVAAGGLLAWWAATVRPHRPSRAWGVLGCLATVAGVGVAPGLLGRTWGLTAGLATVALVALPTLLLGRGGVLPRRPAALAAGAGPAALLAALVTLPWVGPEVTGLLGALAVIVATELTVRRGGSATPATEGAGRSGTPWAGVGAGLLLASTVWYAGTEMPWPWPLAAVVAGVGLTLVPAGARLRPTTGLVLLTAGVVTLVALPAPRRWLLRTVIDNQFLPTVGLAGGCLALVLAGVVLGALPGLAVGALATADRALHRLAPAAAGGLLAADAVARGTGGHAVGIAAGGCLLALGARRAHGTAAAPGWLAPGAALVLGLLAVLSATGHVGAPAVPEGLTVDATHAAPGILLLHGRAGGSGPGRDEMVLVSGQVAARTSPPRLADDLLAGALAALVPPRAERVLLVGSGSGRVRRALTAGGVGEVVLHEPSRALAHLAHALVGDAGLPAPRISPSPAGWLREAGTFDAVISQVEDPTAPAFAPFFTREAHRTARALLSPGGVFVQRLNVDRLGPRGVLAHVLLLRETFPRTHVATADHARDGVVLLLGLTAEEGDDAHARLAAARLSLDPATNPLATPELRDVLGDALLLQPDDLLATFAAGPREIKAAEEVDPEPPADAWAPGGDALRFAAPEAIGRSLAQALLYARIANVDLDLHVEPAQGPEGYQRWDLLPVETRLPEPWTVLGGVVRQQNVLTEFLHARGVYRESSRRLSFERPGGRLAVTVERRTRVTGNTLIASLDAQTSGQASRRGQALVRGHPALWAFDEPSTDQQELTLTWHCPFQGSLYAVQYGLSDGKPGRPDEPLGLLVDSVRCPH